MAGRSGLGLRPANAQEEDPEKPASDVFDPLQRGSSTAAAEVGQKGPVNVHSTEEKAAVAPLPTVETTTKAEEAAARGDGEAAAAAGKGLTELPVVEEEVVEWILVRDASSLGHIDSETPLLIYEEETMEGTGKNLRQVVVTPSMGMTRLPEEEVDMILSLEPCSIRPYDEDTLRMLYPPELIDERREVIRKAVELSEEGKEEFIWFQDWIRGELEEKGYVEVPNKFIEHRNELCEWMQEEFDQMFQRLDLPDSYFASSSNDDDDDDDKEEVAPESTFN